MQSEYRPPAAPLGSPPALPVQPLWKAVAAGVAASFAAIAFLSALTAVVVVTLEPDVATTGGLTLGRMQQFPGLPKVLLAVYALAGLAGGWSAALVRRRRSMRVAFVLSAIFAAIVSFFVFLAGRQATWGQMANLATYTVGAFLSGGVARRRDAG